MICEAILQRIRHYEDYQLTKVPSRKKEIKIASQVSPWGYQIAIGGVEDVEGREVLFRTSN